MPRETGFGAGTDGCTGVDGAEGRGDGAFSATGGGGAGVRDAAGSTRGASRTAVSVPERFPNIV